MPTRTGALSALCLPEVAFMVVQLIRLYSYVVLAAVLLSWLPDLRENAVGRFITRATEPVFQAVRKVVPPLGGLDVAPMVVLLALQLILRVLR
jgi:YggT family protein